MLVQCIEPSHVNGGIAAAVVVCSIHILRAENFNPTLRTRQTAQVPQSQAEADVWREGEWFIARARGVEVASQGKTRAEVRFSEAWATPRPVSY